MKLRTQSLPKPRTILIEVESKNLPTTQNTQVTGYVAQQNIILKAYSIQSSTIYVPEVFWTIALVARYSQLQQTQNIRIIHILQNTRKQIKLNRNASIMSTVNYELKFFQSPFSFVENEKPTCNMGYPSHRLPCTTKHKLKSCTSKREHHRITRPNSPGPYLLRHNTSY